MHAANVSVDSVAARRVQLTARSDPTKRRDAGVSAVSTRCTTCNLRELCLPCGLHASDAGLLGDMVYTRKRVKRGEILFRSGGDFDSLYAVRSGFFKSSVVLELSLIHI